MEHDKAIRLVNEALSREYNSVSTYVLSSSPWTTPEDADALKVLEEIRAAQAQTASWLTTRLREDFSAGLTLRAFEYWNRDLNYLSIPYLVRFCADHFARVAVEYDAVVKEAGDDAALKAIFARLRDEAKAHGRKLAPHVPSWTEHPKEAAP